MCVFEWEGGGGGGEGVEGDVVFLSFTVFKISK